MPMAMDFGTCNTVFARWNAAAGRADLVALGRPHLSDPYFTLHAAAQYNVRSHRAPPQYDPGRSQLYRLVEQSRTELEDLKLKTRPKTHDPSLRKAAE